MPQQTAVPKSSDVPHASTSIDPAQVLEERFGLREFRPGQRQVIDCLLAGGGGLGGVSTGGGKALCYPASAPLSGRRQAGGPAPLAVMKGQSE